MGYGAYYRKTDYGNFNIAAYNTDSFGGSVKFQLPISEIESLGLSLSFDQTKLATNFFSSRQLTDFYNSEGSDFNTYSGSVTWSRFTLDRGVFPTNGSSNAISLSVTLPGSNLNFGLYPEALYLDLDLTLEFYSRMGTQRLHRHISIFMQAVCALSEGLSKIT